MACLRDVDLERDALYGARSLLVEADVRVLGPCPVVPVAPESVRASDSMENLTPACWSGSWQIADGAALTLCAGWLGELPPQHSRRNQGGTVRRELT